LNRYATIVSLLADHNRSQRQGHGLIAGVTISLLSLLIVSLSSSNPNHYHVLQSRNRQSHH
jgi:hypothetical protein